MNIKNNNFNLLRFIFAGLVIISHAPELRDGNRSNEILTNIFGTISFGEFSVDSFFIISGYLIIKSWMQNPDLISFMKSRILRIYPGFLVASLISAFVVGPIYGVEGYLSDFTYFNYAISAIFLRVPSTPIVFPGTPYPIVNASMWTISYEFSCYMLVLIFGVLKLYKKRLFIPMLFLLATSIFVADNMKIIDLGKMQKIVRFLMIFFAGSCFFLFEKRISWKFTYSLLAGLLAMLFMFNSILAEVSVAIFWGYAILYFAKNAEQLKFFKDMPDISYGLYLYAWPVTKIIYWNWPNVGIYYCMLLTVLVSAVLGMFSWFLVEKPFVKLKYFRRNIPVSG